MDWRWDQGRLGYFQFDEIKLIASALSRIDGMTLPTAKEPDVLRAVLKRYSHQPFAPERYTVWRNYKRVFGCQLLAAAIEKKLICTDLCKLLAKSDVDVDNYFLHLANKFYHPSPVFEGYQTTSAQAFPIAAILKYLLAKAATGGVPAISTEQVFHYLIANNIEGTEDMEFYLALKNKPISFEADDARQVREFLRFISQLSFLKWNNGELFLDLISKEEILKIWAVINPIILPREEKPDLEILRLGSHFTGAELGEITATAAVSVFDLEFSEGSKTKVTHLRTERSSKLKEIYFEHTENPEICDICAMDTPSRYPWTEHLIELHHLLPLSSPIRVEQATTSLKDIVGLCPSCHRATHKFYNKWLKKEKIKDFRTYEEAKAVYNLTKQQTVLN
jgi:hypothetical protein